jgi:hypothetical protein
MKAPIYHMQTGETPERLTVACGKKKGLAMEEKEFRKRMKDGFDSLFLCDACIRIAKKKKSV